MKSGLNPVGIFGGTFDPIHFGHLRLAQEVAEHCGLEAVHIIPAGKPPHRNEPVCDPALRMEMVRIASTGNPLFFPDDREIAKKTPCYSVETLEELRKEWGNDKPVCLMVGADAFLGLASWHEWRRLFDLAHVLVAQRPGFDIESRMTDPLRSEYRSRLSGDREKLRHLPSGLIMTMEITPLDISSSMIRDCLEKGHSPRYLLPEEVLVYIRKHGLYQEKNGF